MVLARLRFGERAIGMTSNPQWGEPPSGSQPWGPPGSSSSGSSSPGESRPASLDTMRDLPFSSDTRSRRVPLIAASMIIALALIIGVLVTRSGSDDPAAASGPRDTTPYTTAAPDAVSSRPSFESSDTAPGDASAPAHLPAGARALSDVAAKTLQQGTARMSMTVNMPIPGLSKGPMTVEGAVDLDRGLMAYTMDFSALLAGEDVPTGVDGKVEAVQSGMVMFMRGSLFDAVPGAEGKWMRMDLIPTAAATGVDTNKLAKVSGNSPSSALDMLEQAGSVVDMGDDVVRGTTTRHYSASIDIEALYRSSGAVVDEAAFAELMSTMSMRSIPVDVWIDDAGRVRRQEMVLNMGGSMMHSVVELYDFGVKTDIVVPAMSDSVDLLDLAARG
jgi:hypothetical protein